MFLPPAIAAAFTPAQLDAMDDFISQYCSPFRNADLIKLDLAKMLLEQQKITAQSISPSLKCQK